MRSFNYLRRQGLHKRQKKLRLSGSFQAPLCKGICKCAKHACRRRRDGFGNRAAVGGICECAKHACRRRRDGFNAPPLCKGRGTTKWWKGCKNNPSPPAAELPLHKGAFLSIVLLFYFLSSFFSPRSGLSFLKNAEIFIIFFVGARLSLTTPRFGAII